MMLKPMLHIEWEINDKFFGCLGFGGQVDFIRGAAEGFDGKGKPIIALPAATKRGETKIVPTIKSGTFKFSIKSGPSHIRIEMFLEFLLRIS